MATRKAPPKKQRAQTRAVQKSAAIRKAKTTAQPRKPLDVASVAKIVQPGQRFSQVVGSDPYVIAQTLISAAIGDNEAIIQLAVEIEERYLHAASLLQTRRGAITGEDIEVEPGDDSEAAKDIADLFRREVVEQPQFDTLVVDLLDALPKGYSVVQPHWDTTGPYWRYADYEFVDQRFFVYDRATLSELRMRVEGQPDGVPIEPGQFIIHRPRIKPGLPVRAGLVRPMAVAYLFHATGLKQWSTLIDVYGMPVRIGKYTPGIDTTQQELEELRTALINLGHDAACMVPNTMEISVLDARRPGGGGENIYASFLDYIDKQCSKLILGGTMLSDEGASLSQAQVHNQVRQDIKAADAKALNATLTQQVAIPWTRFNFGEQAVAPRVRISVDPPEDLKALTEALLPWVAQGHLKIKAGDIRGKFGLEAPTDSDETLGGEPPAPKLTPNPLLNQPPVEPEV